MKLIMFIEQSFKIMRKADYYIKYFACGVNHGNIMSRKFKLFILLMLLGEKMEKKKCVQCGKVFTIKDTEKQFFENRNLNFPKRCKECREKNNPHQVKTNTYQGTPRKEKVFTIKKTYLILTILIIAFSVLYIKSKNSSEEYHIPQEVNVSDSNTFKSESLLQEHFNKHGSEFGYANISQYESGANEVIDSPDALHKTEAEDGDSIYYIQATNEFVILSTEGYIRTYFKPEDGIDYYNRQ